MRQVITFLEPAAVRLLHPLVPAGDVLFAEHGVAPAREQVRVEVAHHLQPALEFREGPKGECAALEVLNLYECSALTSLPPQLGECAALRTIDYTYNSLSGTIPASLCGLRLLAKLLFRPLVGSFLTRESKETPHLRRRLSSENPVG